MSLHLRKLLQEGNSGNIKSIKKIIRHYKKSAPLIQSNIEDWLATEIKKKYSSFLHWLAFLGEIQLFKALLNKGADFAVKNSHGRHPLHYAVAQGHHGIVELILNADHRCSQTYSFPTKYLEMHAEDINGWTPQRIAFEKQDIYLMNRFASYQQSFLFDSKRTFAFVSSYDLMGISPFSLNWAEVACMGSQYDWISAPTGQLVYLNGGGSITRFCSGFNIGNDYFLLAGEGVSRISDSMHDHSSAYSVSFNYQYPLCRHTVQGIPVIHENFYSINSIAEQGQCYAGMNYVILKLEPKAEKYFGHVQLTATVPPRGSDIVVSHYPAGLPKKISEGTVTEVDTSQGRINHSAHTVRESSGAPTGNRRTKEVFAVHATGNNTQTYHASVLVSEIAKTSLIVKGILNFGLMKQPTALRANESKKDSPEYQSTLSFGN